MNTLDIPYFDGADLNTPFAELDDLLLGNPPQFINNQPWPLPGEVPLVSFNIAHGADAVFLKFKVKEKYFKAVYTNTNDLVFKDSCVEFFFAPDDSGSYYNFEFNAIGTCYAAYGTPAKRELLGVELIHRIRVSVSNNITSGSELPIKWDITLAIPFKTFVYHQVTSLTGQRCRANFYKCGDDMPWPHYLCWNNVNSAKPNFHLPQYFGQLIFG
jgi:hypothetical protein